MVVFYLDDNLLIHSEFMNAVKIKLLITNAQKTEGINE